MSDADLDWITGRLLLAVEREEPLTPQALTFLLRRYLMTGGADLSQALGPALAVALDRCEAAAQPSSSSDGRDADEDQPTTPAVCGVAGAGDRTAGPSLRPDVPPAEWLELFVEAASLSDDDRLTRVAASLVAGLAAAWPSRGDVAPALRSVEACLSATRHERMAANAAAAVDELERIIGIAYAPGEGLARRVAGARREPGRLIDHTSGASALLTAYAVAGRLPYSMLAEELMQFARRSWWVEGRGGFRTSTIIGGSVSSAGARPEDEFVANCEAARVLCRLAMLHRDDDYLAAAVVAVESDYAGDATRTLESLEETYRTLGTDAALYGLALLDRESLGH